MVVSNSRLPPGAVARNSPRTASPRMMTFSTWFALVRSRNVLNGILSVEPLVVWNRLQRRKTRTMMTTQRRAVLTVEFNECLQGGTRCCQRAQRDGNGLRRVEILRFFVRGCLYARDVRQVCVQPFQLQAVADERAFLHLEGAEVGLQIDGAEVGAVDERHELQRGGLFLA